MKNAEAKKNIITYTDSFLREWKKRKAQEEEEAVKAFNTPEYQQMLKELQKQNAAKGIAI